MIKHWIPIKVLSLIDYHQLGLTAFTPQYKCKCKTYTMHCTVILED